MTFSVSRSFFSLSIDPWFNSPFQMSFPWPIDSDYTVTHHNEDNDNDDSNSSGRENGKSRRSVAHRLDADDPGFVDSVVMAQLEFTCLCIGPLLSWRSSNLHLSAPGVWACRHLSPTTMNLTFTLDNSLHPFYRGSSVLGPAFPYSLCQTSQQGCTFP